MQVVCQVIGVANRTETAELRSNGFKYMRDNFVGTKEGMARFRHFHEPKGFSH
jgi:hypothetical protein